MTQTRSLLVAAAVLSLAAPALAAPAPTTRLTWLGHAAFAITTPGGKTLLVDPWIKNPTMAGKPAPEALKKVDYILITHGHFDHVGEAVEIAKATGARLVATFELGNQLARLLGFPGNQMGFDTLGNIGGRITLADGEVTVDFVPAVHASGIDTPGGDKAGTPIAYGGAPSGFVIRIKNGPSIYHSGDTAFFHDMDLIGEGGLDVALINIGGHFGMEPAAAVRAAQAVKPRLVVPHHYKTFPVLTQDPKAFFEGLDKAGIAHANPAPGETLVFEGASLKK